MNSRAVKPIKEGFRFGRFELDVHARELRKDGVRLRLQEQPFAVLTMLLEHAGDVLTRDDLRRRLWPDGTFVDFEHGLNAAVKRLRSTLGDSADDPRFIETLHRRGYRFIAAVDRIGTRPAVSGEAIRMKARLAVLPFTTRGGGESDYFTEGLTEEMITQLGRASAGRIAIIARSSTMLAGRSSRSAREVGERLQADYLVEGTAHLDGDRVRITTRLVETGTETQLWAQSYERHLADWFRVQSEVATEVVQSLALELLPDSAARMRAGSRHTGAQQAYLKGRYHWNKAGDSGLKDAIVFYRRALELDPDFTLALSALARAEIAAADYYVCEPLTAFESARQSAARALALDPSDSEAHVALAEVHKTVDWDWTAAEAAYRSALAANPSNEAAYRLYGLFLAVRGRTADATAAARHACDLDPLCLVVNTSAAWVYYLDRDYERAIDWCRHTLDMDAGFAAAHRVMGAALLQAGRVDEAVDAFEAALAKRPDTVSVAWLAHALATHGSRDRAGVLLQQLDDNPPCYVSRYHVALAQTALGDVDRAMGSLGAAFDARDPAIVNVRLEPRFEPLRFDARYRAFTDRLGLP